MVIKELQDSPLESWPFLEGIITDVTRQYKEGTTKENAYHSQLALLYANLKNVEEFRKHAAMVPDDADANDKMNVFISLGRMMIYEKKLEEAIPYYEKCLQVDPGHEMALDEIGWCCYELKRYEAAEGWFRSVISADDVDSPSAWHGLGLTLSAMKRYVEAIPCFENAFKHEGTAVNTNYYEYLIGLCYANDNDFYRAMAHYMKSLDADPRYAASLVNIAALYYEHESDIKTAIEYLKKAEELAEADDDVHTLQLAYMNLSRLYTRLADYDLKEHYTAKLLELLGFGAPSDDEETEDEFDDESDDDPNV